MSEKPKKMTTRMKAASDAARVGQKKTLKREFYDRTREVLEDCPGPFNACILNDIEEMEQWIDGVEQILDPNQRVETLLPEDALNLRQGLAHMRVLVNLEGADKDFQNLFYALLFMSEAREWQDQNFWISRPAWLMKYLVHTPEQKDEVKVEEEVEPATCFKCGERDPTKRIKLDTGEFVWVHKQAKGRPGECEK